MTYKLTIRRFDERDLNIDCKFLPDGELEIYVKALIEDIESSDNTSQVSLLKCSYNECEIKIVTNISLMELKLSISLILSSNSYRCILIIKDLLPMRKINNEKS